MNQSARVVITWTLFWLLVAGGSVYALPGFGADLFQKFSIVAVYFFSFAVLGGYYYRINQPLPDHPPLRNQLPFIAFAAIALIASCLVIEAIFQINPQTYEKIVMSEFYFPLFRLETTVAKIFDVSFQQVFIFGFLKKMNEQNHSKSRIMILFSFCFFMVHLPLLFNLKLLYALYFIVPSLFAGLVFSYLILYHRYGQSLAFAIHLLFYLLIGAYLRM